MMCGIELYVPSTWGISIDWAQLLSGIQESGNQGIKGEKQVRIEGRPHFPGSRSSISESEKITALKL